MTRARWFLLLLALILLLIPILARCILSTPVASPPGVPENWRRHKEALGRFEVWLPEEWEGPGSVRTVIYSMHEVGDGVAAPLLLSALRSSEGSVKEWVTVRDFDIASKFYAPLVGEELARECSRNDPVLPLSFNGVVYLDTSNVTIIEQDEGGAVIAYQSEIFDRSVDKSTVRTIAYAVSRNHVYQIHLHTVEENDSADVPTHERILKTFRILE